MSTPFTRAIVRLPGRHMAHGITTAGLGSPSYRLALRQHAAYVRALQRCGLVVTELPPLEAFPDSTFVEDVALCTRAGALLTRPAAGSRRGERDHMRAALHAHYGRHAELTAPATLDAGDVMMVGDHYYIGRSARTNDEGARQLAAILQQWGMTTEEVPLRDVLHLKTGVSYLDHGHMLVCGEFTDHPAFARYERIVVPPHEAYAANCLWVNGRVLVPAGHPQTAAMIRDLGYDIILLEMSEFQKLDGGLSCLSLRF